MMSAPERLFRLEPVTHGGVRGYRLHARVPDPRLVVRRTGEPASAPHPGSFVRIDQRLFELVTVSPDGHGGLLFLLEPADPRATVRLHLDWSGDGLARFEDEARAELLRQRSYRGLAALLPLVGLLPEARRVALERQIGVPAKRAARVSAVVFGLPALALAIYGNIASTAGSLAAHTLPTPPTWLLLAAIYLTLESALRLVATEPLGSLPIVLVAALLERIGMIEPVPADAGPRAPDAAAATDLLVDRVRRLPAPGGGGPELRIECATPRAWPPGQVLIWEDGAWELAETRRETRAGRDIQVHRLRPADPDAVVRNVIRYRPDDRRIEATAQRTRDFAERIHLLKAFAGFAPAEHQLRWQDEHGFPARRATIQSAVLELLFAVPLLRSAVWALPQLPGIRLLIVVAGLVAAALCVEGALRLWRGLVAGLPSGTFVLELFERIERRHRA